MDRPHSEAFRIFQIPAATRRQIGFKRPAALITLIFLLAPACDLPEPPKVVTISNVPTFRPASPEQVQTVEQAMAAIITVCRDDLRLPVVDPLEVRLYKNTASFASYGTKAWIFRNDVAHLAGTAEKNKIHINLDKTQHEPWASAIWVLAHEYGHNVENDLMTIRVHPRWFIEGFAEWVAATVVDALHWQSYALTIRRINVQLARHREFIPALSSLSDNRDWESFIRKPKGGVTAYTLAAAAVDRLIEKAGAASAIEYISSGDFESAFGESLAEFEIDVQKIGGEFERRQQREFLMRKPEWKIGDRWLYEETAPGRKTALTAQVAKEDSVRGRLVFVVKFGDGEELYDKDTLGFIATMKNGKLTTYRDEPNRMFEWPLQAAKEWKNTYRLRDFETKKTDVIDRTMVVANLEEITVPAGRFISAKIEAYNNESGRLMAEYWYAPGAKWSVKTINYGAENGFARLRELRSFKVDP
jgi:hypothetical protein